MLDTVERARSLATVAGTLRTLATKHPETALHRAADGHLDAVYVAAEYAFGRGRRAVKRSALRSALTSGTRAAAHRAVSGVGGAVREAFKRVLPDTLRPVLVNGGDTAVTMLQRKLRSAEFRAAAPRGKVDVNMRFDVTNPSVKRWIKAHTGELIKELEETTRNDVRDAIDRAYDGGKQADAFDTILKAVGDEKRAEVIARTEIMTAANEGQRQAWSQAVEQGLLSKSATRVWIATEVRACPICAAVDGETTTLNGQYSVPGPPAHPNCRCTEGIS